MSVGVVATVATGLFAGVATSITLVEHPARLACGPAFARWWMSGSLAWLAGGVLLGALIPFTLIVVVPTNTRLLDDRLDSAFPRRGDAPAAMGPTPCRANGGGRGGVRAVRRAAVPRLKSEGTRR